VDGVADGVVGVRTTRVEVCRSFRLQRCLYNEEKEREYDYKVILLDEKSFKLNSVSFRIRFNVREKKNVISRDLIAQSQIIVNN